jgi:hypothetical protein
MIHTQTLDRTPLDEGSVRHQDLYLTRRRIHKRKTSMLLAGLEPSIPASYRPQTYTLVRAVSRIGRFIYSYSNNAFDFCTESTPFLSCSENERRLQGLLSAYVDSRPSVTIPNPFALSFYRSRTIESLHLSILGRCMFYLLPLEASCSVHMAML